MMLCQNPQACSFSITKPCGKQLNVLDRSVSNASYSPPCSSDFLDLSTIATRKLSRLKPLRKQA